MKGTKSVMYIHGVENVLQNSLLWGIKNIEKISTSGYDPQQQR